MMFYPPSQYLTNVVMPCLSHLGWAEQNLGLVLAVIPYAASVCPSTEADQFGPYHMSHEQHWAIWDTYLAKDAELASRVRGLASQHRFVDDPDLELSLNAGYATAIAASGLQAQAGQEPLPSSFFELVRLWQDSASQQLPAEVFMSLYPELKDQWPKIAA